MASWRGLPEGRDTSQTWSEMLPVDGHSEKAKREGLSLVTDAT